MSQLPSQPDWFWDSLLPSLGSGATQAVFFNPYDRALYLSVHHRRPFLHVENFTNPFQGFANAAVYRTLSGASYLFWQDQARALINGKAPELQKKRPMVFDTGVGIIAGAMNGLLLNGIQTVKFRMWSDNDSRGFIAVAKEMKAQGGLRVFFRGIQVCVLRDVTFGISYEVIRSPEYVSQYGTTAEFAANFAAASTATAMSSPFNYCRNQIYGTPSLASPLGWVKLLFYLGKEVYELPNHRKRVRFLNQRLNIGWGCVRVGLGMACGQYLREAFASGLRSARGKSD